MPDIMAAADIVEPAVQPTFWDLQIFVFPSAKMMMMAEMQTEDFGGWIFWFQTLRITYLAGVNESADKIHGDGLDDRRVEGGNPGGTPGPCQLENGREPGGGESHVEGDPEPGHVGAVEKGLPGENDSADTKRGRRDDIGPAADWFAVKGGILARHDGGGDQERNSCIIDAGETFHKALLGDAVHRVPHAAADQTFAGREEEHGRKKDVGIGGEREIHG